NLAMVTYSIDQKDRTPAKDSVITGRDDNPTVQRQDIWWWYKELVKSYAGINSRSSSNDYVFQCPKDRGWPSHASSGNFYGQPHHQNPTLDYGSYVYNGCDNQGNVNHLLGTGPDFKGITLSSIRHPSRTVLMSEWPIHWSYSWHDNKFGNADVPFADALVQ